MDSSDLTSAVLKARENEKRKIREEILTSGFFRREVLEAEVIGEMLREGEIALQHSARFLSNSSSLWPLQAGSRVLFSSPGDSTRCNDRSHVLSVRPGDLSGGLHLATCLEGGSYGNLPSVSHPGVGICSKLPLGTSLQDSTSGRLSMRNLPGNNVSYGLPFQLQPGGTSEIPNNPVIDLRRTLLLSKEGENDANLVFANRPQVVVSGGPLLENHLDDGSDGRLSSTHLAGCNVSTGLCLQQEGVTGEELSKRMIDPKGTLSSVKPEAGGAAGTKRKLETAVDSEDGITSSGERKKSQKVWNCALCQVSVQSEVSFEDHLKGKKHRAKEKAIAITNKTMDDNCDSKPREAGNSVTLPMPSDTIEAINMNTENESANFKFCCKICNVGTNNESLMIAHRSADEHNALMQQKGASLVAVRNTKI